MARRRKKKSNMIEDTEEQDKTQVTDSTEAQKENEEGTENDTEKKEDFEAKFLEMNDKFLRLYSEFENFRRRTAKERVDLLTNSRGEAMKNLIPVIDDFERAALNNEKVDDATTLKEGFGLIHHKFLSLLKNEGLQPMETAAGDQFDTDKHEAVTQIPAPEESLKGKVVDVIEKGYVLNEKVLRYAKVVTGS